MKKLLIFLCLLIASPAFATYYLRTDCGTVAGPVEGDVCSQSTTVSGRTSGHLYIYRSAAWVDVDTSGTGSPTTATYITQTPDAGLDNEQAMSVLATGIVKNQTGTGVQSIAAAGTDYVAPTGSGAGLTALNASQLTTGTAAAARLGSGTPDATNYLRGDNTWTAITTVPALAANGVNCSAGNAPLGVDAAGAVEGCFDVTTQVEMNTHSALTGTGAHGATTTNTASQLVARDASGNFAAGTITAALTGNVTGNVSGNAATATTSSALAAAGWIPPLVTVATLPATPVDGQEVTVTDALATTDCETGGGTYRNRCVWNAGGGSWDLALSGVSGSSQTLESVMTNGNATTKCTEADPCQFGNGTVYINVYVSDANQMVIEPSVAADRYFTCMTNQVCGFYDTEGAAAILTIDPDAASQLGKYTFGTAYKPTKTVYFPAASLTTDTAQCASPALATINSGAPRYTIICTENDASSIYGEAVMGKSWDGGTVTFTHHYVQTAADTGSMFGDIAASCRLATATINNTWGTEIAIDDAAVTGSNAIDMTTSAAVTPNGTCTAGTSRLLQFRWQYDATANPTTAAATLHHLGFTMEYSVTSLSD